VDMRLLFLSLKATERVCGQEISDKSNAFRDEKASHSKKCGQVTDRYANTQMTSAKVFLVCGCSFVYSYLGILFLLALIDR